MGVLTFWLCVYPNLKLPAKFKIFDFQKCDGESCPIAHLHLYYYDSILERSEGSS